MGDVVVDEEVEEVGEAWVILDEHEEGHFGVDEFAGDGVEVNLDCAQLVLVVYLDCLNP